MRGWVGRWKDVVTEEREGDKQSRQGDLLLLLILHRKAVA